MDQNQILGCTDNSQVWAKKAFRSPEKRCKSQRDLPGATQLPIILCGIIQQ